MSEIEVFVAPIKIFWIEAPTTIKNKEKIELLRNDILLVPCTFDFLLELKDKEIDKSIILINFDNILELVHNEKFIQTFHNIAGLLEFIINNFAKKTIFHTTHINHNYQNDIKKLGLIYLEINLEEIKMLKYFITKITKKFFNIINIHTRSFLRIHFYPMNKIFVSIKNITQNSSEIKSYLKDLSINGLGIIFEDNDMFKHYHMKDLLHIKINFPGSIINIKKSIVVRLDSENNEIGIVYNMDDGDMITEHDSFALIEIIYKNLEEVLKKFGKDYDLNFIKIEL